MSFVNFIRLISPDGGTWEEYARRKWGVGVTRYHGWFDGKVTKAWTKILSRPDASLRWKSLKNKGWRETVRRNPGADPLRGDCGTYALAYAELHKAQNPTIVFFLGDKITLSANDKEALQELDVSELDFVHVAVKIDGKMYDAEGVFTNEKAGKEYGAAIASEFSYKKNKSQLGTVIRNNTNFTQDWQYWYAKLTRGGARRNPTDKWTRIGEWWIDDSGTALYADGDPKYVTKANPMKLPHFVPLPGFRSRPSGEKLRRNPLHPKAAAYLDALERIAGEKQVLYFGPFQLIGDRKGGILGKLELHFPHWGKNGDPIVHIGYIGVDVAENRRKGYGTRLMQMLIQAADEVGLDMDLDIDPQKAQGDKKPPMNATQLHGFYSKFGFLSVSKSQKKKMRRTR